MRAATSPSLRMLRSDPHVARLGASWFAVVVVLSMMVVAPFVLYLRGKEIRNRLTFEVGAMELSVERASRAMADRERALRAFLYLPERRRLEDYQVANVTLTAALESARMTGSGEVETRTRAIDRMMELSIAWDAAATPLIERASRGERDLLASDDTTRPGPIYDDFQSVARELLLSFERERVVLISEMAAADEARLALPLVLALLGLAVLSYVGWLSVDALRSLSLARAEQQRLSRILDHMADPVLVTDRTGQVTLANPAARGELGIHPGTPILALAPRLAPFAPTPAANDAGAPAMPIDENATPRAILDALASASPLLAAEARIRHGGDERPVSVTSAPIVISGQVVGAVTVVRDLSDRVRYEKERLKSERFHALGAMSERIAHDFGNYLEAASAASAMLERPSAADPAKRARWVALIRTTIDEGRNVLSSLRTMSFISYRKPRFSTLALAPMVVRAIEVARMARPERTAAVVIEEDVPADLHIQASESDLVRAIVNVVVNAIDALPRGGRVTLHARREGDRVVLAIHDTGIGIPFEDHERIFDMYFTTKGDRGSGMGLALAREVVSLHGGEMRLESAPGEGSTFTFSIPRAPESPASASLATDEQRHQEAP